MTVKNFINSSGDLDYPTILPSLDLDFANSRTLDPRIAFTRSSGGSYVGADGLIKYAGVNQPRFDHDPVTGESLGLLIEEQRTNGVNNSTTFAFYDTNNLTDGTLNPDGSAAIVRIPNANGTYHGFIGATNTPINLDTIGLAVGATYDINFSMWLKDYNNSDMGVLFVNAAYLAGAPPTNITYQLKIAKPKGAYWGGGTVQTGWERIYERIIPYPNGWYRFIQSSRYTRQANQNSIECGIQIYSKKNEQVYYGNNSSGIYIWGPQIERGATQTSYIPTVASTRTRSADNATMTGTNFSSWYNSREGTLFAASRVNALGSLVFPGIAYVDDGTTINSMGFYINDAGDDKIGVEAYISGIEQYQFFSGSAVIADQLNKVISSYSINNFSAAFSSRTLSQRDNFGTIPTVDRLRIGALRGNVYKLNGTISRFTYYPKRLPNSQLQALTR